MTKIDETKLKNLQTTGELLDKKYGKEGTATRTAFHEKSISWYYGELLRNRRKELDLIQKEVADMAGTVRSYIARV